MSRFADLQQVITQAAEGYNGTDDEDTVFANLVTASVTDHEQSVLRQAARAIVAGSPMTTVDWNI